MVQFGLESERSCGDYVHMILGSNRSDINRKVSAVAAEQPDPGESHRVIKNKLYYERPAACA